MIYLTDEELIKKCASGSSTAFDELYNRYSNQLVNFICRIINDFPRAEDLFQETFIRVIENAEKFNDNYKFSTWIYRIAINLSYNELKRQKLVAAPVKIESEEEYYSTIYNNADYNDPQSKMEIRENQEKIQKGLSELSENHRIVFILKFHQELSYKEISLITGVSIGTVKSRIYYALQHLKEILEYLS